MAEESAKQPWMDLGENVRYQTKGNQLFIVMDLTHDGGLIVPKDGKPPKNHRLASTGGNRPMAVAHATNGLPLTLGINAYFPIPPKKAAAK